MQLARIPYLVCGASKLQLSHLHGRPQKFFSVGGGNVDILLVFFSGCWRRNAYGHIHKNVQCYGKSCIQCFPCKKTLH